MRLQSAAPGENPVCLPDVALIQRRGYGEGTMELLVGSDSIVGAAPGDKQTSGVPFSTSAISPHSSVAGDVQNEKGQAKQEMNK